jgi:hypothetical protein
LGGIIIDRVDSITDLGVVMDSRMSYSRHIDGTVGKALAILGPVRRLSGVLRDAYTLRTFYVSLVRPKLEYASCVWRPVYDVHVNRFERVQRKFVRNALRGLEWTPMYHLPPYVDRCALIRLEPLTRRRSDACVIVFNVLSGWVGSPNSGSPVNVVVPRYRTRGGDFFRIDFHRTNYGVHKPLNDAVRHFNEVASLFDFHLSKNQFFNRPRSVL